MLLLLLNLACAQQQDLWHLRIEVGESHPQVVPRAAEAEVSWLGETQVVTLQREAGIWSGEFSGPPTTYLPLTLRTGYLGDGSVGTTPLEVRYQSLEWLDGGDQTLSYTLGVRGIQRSSSQPTMRSAEHFEAAQVLLGIVWALAVLVFVLWLPSARGGGRVLPWRRGWSPVFWFALAVAWTWPAARAGSVVVGRHFDTAGTVWVLGAASRLVSGGLQDPLTAFPYGADYGALDSFTLLPIGALLSWLGAVRLHGALQILGVALSAWAAEGFAREVGARRPWTLLAGISFAFSGVASWGLLEGHVYHLFDPWLPLFAWAWWRALHTRRRVLDGVLAGLAFCGALLTTGYLGVSAALVAVVFLIGSRRAWRPAMAAALLVAPVGVWYLFQMGGVDGDMSAQKLQLGSASLMRLAGPTGELDRLEHSTGMALCAVTLALCMLAPRVLRHWRLLLGASLLALILSLGPSLQLSPQFSLPTPMALVADLPGAGLLRFPARLLWVFSLCGGALAARVATELEGRRYAWMLLPLAVLGAFLVQRVPARQTARPAELPSAYAELSGAVLDYFPESLNPNGEEDAWFTGIGCLYQSSHGLPIADLCLWPGKVLADQSDSLKSPRMRFSRWLTGRLLVGDTEGARSGLVGLGFSALAAHTDAFRRADRQRVEALIPQLGTVIAQEGGAESVLLVQLAGEGAPPDLDEVVDSVGVGEAVRDASLTVELKAVDRGERKATAVLYQKGQVVASERLADDGASPGDWGHDHVYIAHFPEVPFGPLELEVTVEGAWGWRGRYTAMSTRDHVAFVEDDGALRPLATVPYSFSPRIVGYSVEAATAGWLTYGIAAAGLLLLGRSRSGRRSRTPAR